MAFEDWSTNPASNTLIGSINWSEGQLPGTVNGSARQMMADLATWRDKLLGGSSPFALTSGATFTGEVAFSAPSHFLAAVDLTYTGNATLTLNSVGVVIARMAAQAAGNIVFYRNAGTGDSAVWATDGTYFDVFLPMRRNGNTVWDAGNLPSPATQAALSAVAATVPGIGQTWQNVTGSRASGTSYSNSTTRPITVKVIGGTINGSPCSIVVDGIKVAAAGTFGSTNVVYDMSAQVPPGSTYVITYTAIDTIAELR